MKAMSIKEINAAIKAGYVVILVTPTLRLAGGLTVPAGVTLKAA